MMTERTILMLAFPDAQILDITGPLQMFAAANDEIDFGHYRIEIAAPQPGPFVTSSRVQLVADLSFDEIDDTRLADTHILMVAMRVYSAKLSAVSSRRWSVERWAARGASPPSAPALSSSLRPDCSTGAAQRPIGNRSKP